VQSHVIKPTGRRIYQGRFKLPGDVKQTRISLETTDKRVAEKRLAEIVALAERERHGISVPQPLVEAANRPLIEHLADWKAGQRSRGAASEYIRQVVARVTKLTNECGWKLPKHVTAASFEKWKASHPNLSAKTLNHYLDAIRTLLGWMLRRDLLLKNPLQNVQKIDTRGRETFKRRAFGDDELRRLLDISGKRRLVYLLAACSGLRYKELRFLRASDFELDGPAPYMNIRAEESKNRRATKVPLTPGLVSDIRDWLNKVPSGSTRFFWKGFPSRRTWRKDFEAAGIAHWDASGKKTDFHCLRVTTCTNLHRAGASTPVAQKVMRHLDARHTIETYADHDALGIPAVMAQLERYARSGEVCAHGRAQEMVTTGRLLSRDVTGRFARNVDDARESQQKGREMSHHDTGCHTSSKMEPGGFEPPCHRA